MSGNTIKVRREVVSRKQTPVNTMSAGNQLHNENSAQVKQKPQVITIVVADDHNLVSSGIRLLIETESDLKVIADTGSGKEAVGIVERLKTGCSGHRPDDAGFEWYRGN
jgi:hypothetical protein